MKTFYLSEGDIFERGKISMFLECEVWTEERGGLARRGESYLFINHILVLQNLVSS